MIIGLRYKGLEAFYRTGTTRGDQAPHVKKLRNILAQLEVATGPDDMNLPSFKLHPLEGDLKGHWSVWVNGNLSVTYRFERNDDENVDYK